MKKIIAIVGMCGTGKSTATDIIKGNYNVNSHYFGQIIFDKMDSMKLPRNSENERTAREAYRQELGELALARVISKKIDNETGIIILDGLYSFSEYKFFKEKYIDSFITISLHSNKNIRYDRLSVRESRPLTREEVDSRDFAEIENIEKGGPIAVADYHITNNGSAEELNDQIKLVMAEITGTTQ